MPDIGYIKLYRSITINDIYSLPPLYWRIFERLIIEANHQDIEIPYKKNGITTKKTIKRGEKLTSIRQISKWVGWYERGIFKEPNPKLVKEVLDYLVKENMIFIYDKGNRMETHYKIVNYEVYQDKEDMKVTEQKRLAPSNNNDKNDKKNKYPSSEKFSSDTVEYKLSLLLRDGILKNYPKTKVPDDDSLHKWAVHIDRMIRLDNRTPEEIEKVIEFSLKDNFWQQNILSTEKLRKQFNTLAIKAASTGIKQDQSDKYADVIV